jgi:hypothetical protein
MKSVATIIAGAVVVVALLGMFAGAGYNDGATSRAQLAAEADRYAADAAARAAMHAADRQAEASIEESRQATQRTGMWTQVAPVVVLLLVVGVAGWIVLWWRGRLYLAQVEQAAGVRPAPRLAPPVEVARIARQRQGDAVLVDGQWAIVQDNAIVAWIRPANPAEGE